MVRIAGFPTYSLDGSAVATPVDPEQIRASIVQVWSGLFRHAACYLGWSEGSWWNMEASVEYPNGDRASLLTDGGHVHLKDRHGRILFTRLWPVVD